MPMQTTPDHEALPAPSRALRLPGLDKPHRGQPVRGGADEAMLLLLGKLIGTFPAGRQG